METDKLELDPRILVKNLEITKLTQQVDTLTSKLVELRARHREQTPMYMLGQLNEIYNTLRRIEDEEDYDELSHTSITQADKLKDIITFLEP